VGATKQETSVPSAATKTRAVPPPANGGLFSSPEKRTFVLCLLLVVATLAVYNPVTHNAFVNFDDDRYLIDNPHVHAGLTWKSIRWAFTTYELANWHPLTWISYELDYQLFRLNPAGPHYVNVLLQAADVVLLFLLMQAATGFPWRSLMVAALFALHPVNVESVAWAAERKNVLSMLFFLLTLISYTAFAQKGDWRRYAAAVGLFALGLMAKPQIITLPFVLLLWDYWPLERMLAPSGSGGGRPWLRLVGEKIPFFALSAASAAITMRAQSTGGAVRSAVEYPLDVRLENSIVAYARYIGKAFWPSRLAVMYPHPGDQLPGWQVAGAAALLLAVTVLVLLYWRKRYLAVGWCWFLGTLVPMIGLVQVGEAGLADRYAYVPFIGLFVMVCWSWAEEGEKREASPLWLAVPAGVTLLALGVLTYRQVGLWHDSETLWSHTLAVTDRNFVAHDNLGGALLMEGRTEEAIPHFRAAVAIRRDDPLAHLDLGAYEQERGNLQAAIDQYQMVLGFTTDSLLREQAYANLGSAYRNLEDHAKARQNFELALRLNPNNAIAEVGMGLLAQREGNLAEAARRYSQAMTFEPTAIGYLLLAKAMEQSQHAAEAQAARDEAQRISPDLSEAERASEKLLEH
jgi:protein O-mannosyl-transferase